MSSFINIEYKNFIVLLLSLLMVSCSGFEFEGADDSNVRSYPVSITAAAGANTRISLDDIALSWEQNDTLKIAAVSSDGSSAVSELAIYQIDQDDASKASFAGFVSMLAPPQDCYFLYPNSSAVSYNPSIGRVRLQFNSQSGRHEPLMYAKTSYDENGMYVDLKHTGAMLQLDVQIPEITSISFVGNKLENIYPIELNPDNGEFAFPNEVGVQITVPVQTDGYTYICVPPVRLEKGFSLICSKADGSYFLKSYSSDGSLSGGYDFTDKVGSLIPIVLSGEFETFNISATSLAGTHTKYANLLTGTQVTFNFNKSGSPNKLIEEWGANLLNSDGQVVRTVSFTNATSINGQSVTMNVANNWKLLPAGEYVFTPYYKMYGQKVTLSSQILNIDDPGVKISIAGSTSYDKYKAGNILGANSHTNTLIEGIALETNLDLTLIDSRNLVLDGSNLGSGTWTSGKATYGNVTKTAYKSYSSKATVTVGNLTFNATRDFYITGLPYTGDFTTGNPTSWNPGWAFIGTKYNSSRVVFNSTSAVRSPGFYIPQTSSSTKINVVTYSNCRHNVTSNSSTAKMIISACSSTASSASTSGVTLSLGSDYYQAAGSFGNVGGFKSIGYLLCNSPITLTQSNPSVMFCVSLGSSFLGSNTLVSFGHKIEYN